MNLHANHLAGFDPDCLVCVPQPRWGVPNPELPTATYNAHSTNWNPDPLRPPETDTDPPPRRPVALPPADPSLVGTEYHGPDDEDSGLWAGVAFTLVIALAALVIGIAIGKVLG